MLSGGHFLTARGSAFRGDLLYDPPLSDRDLLYDPLSSAGTAPSLRRRPLRARTLDATEQPKKQILSFLSRSVPLKMTLSLYFDSGFPEPKGFV